MGTENSDPLLAAVIFGILALWPVYRICRRTGIKPWWSLLVLVPGIGLLLVMIVLAHSRWPGLPPLVRRQRKRRRPM